MRKQAGRHAHIAVTHDQHVITRFAHHAVQAEGLGIGDGRLARYDETRADSSAKLADNFFRHGHGRVIRAMDAEQNFILRIILHHEAAQIFLQAIVMAAERLEHTDGRLVSRSRQSGRQEATRGNNNKNAVNERTGKQDRQSRSKDHHNAGLFSIVGAIRSFAGKAVGKKKFAATFSNLVKIVRGRPGRSDERTRCYRSPDNSELYLTRAS